MRHLDLEGQTPVQFAEQGKAQRGRLTHNKTPDSDIGGQQQHQQHEHAPEPGRQGVQAARERAVFVGLLRHGRARRPDRRVQRDPV